MHGVYNIHACIVYKIERERERERETARARERERAPAEPGELALHELTRCGLKFADEAVYSGVLADLVSISLVQYPDVQTDPPHTNPPHTQSITFHSGVMVSGADLRVSCHFHSRSSTCTTAEHRLLAATSSPLYRAKDRRLLNFCIENSIFLPCK